MRLSVCLTAALVCFVPAAAAQGAWVAVCSETPETIDATPYALTSGSPETGCTWTHDDGSTVEIEASVMAETVAELEAATAWLRANEFRDPMLLEDARGRWPVVFTPGGPACYRGECQAVAGGGGLMAYSTASGDYRGVLVLSPEAVLSDEKAYLRALMLATQIAYDGFAPGDWCAPGCSISFGMAEGFRRWWLGRSGPLPPVPARFGEPLATSTDLGDRAAGQATGAFWTFVGFPTTTYQGGFAYASEVYLLIEGMVAVGETALDAVDREIANEAYGPSSNAASGLANDFATFVAYQYRRGPLAPSEEVLPVRAGEIESRAIVHEPLAAVVVPVEIPDVRALAAVTVRVGSASPSISYSVGNAEGVALNLHRLDASGEHEWHFNTARLCPDGGDCSFSIALSNAHPETASRSTQELYTIEVEVSDVCALPAGARGLTMAVDGRDPNGTGRAEMARVSVDLPRASRRRGTRANTITGTAALGAVGMEVGFTGEVECGETFLRLTDLEFDNPALNGILAEPLAASVNGLRLALGTNPQIGDALPDVITNAAVGRESDDDVVRGSGVLQGLRITGRERRRIPGVSGTVEVWTVEGTSVSEMQTDGEAMTDLAADAGATVDGEMDRSTQEAIQQAGLEASTDVRQTLGGLFGALSSDREASVPVTIYYSPVYGAVETITG
ncbi:MAG: hypothetical protein AAFQ43_04055, partial [Bacteroidota bacterium]